MTLLEYTKEAEKTANYPKDFAREYLSLGILGESGEVCDKFKKLIRDKGWYFGRPVEEVSAKAIALELGDVLWYVAMYGKEFGHKNDYVFDGRYAGYDAFNGSVGMVRDAYDLINSYDEFTLTDNIYRMLCKITSVAKAIGYTLNDVAQMNIEKLSSRKERGVLGGSGDNR